MKKKTIKYIGITFIILFSLILIGCTHQTIEFKRESKFNQVMKNANKNYQNNQKGVLKKSSGVIIYKDESNSNSGGGFGPSDINFDMPIKF